MALHMTAAVIGREKELATIKAFLGDVDEGPAALVLSGEAGIGKTILWEAGVEEAGRHYSHVLTCRGIEAEASLSFAGLSELLAPVFDDVAESLLPPRRRALEVALLLVEPGETTPDAHAIGLAVLDVLRALAERGPVLVPLDDLQWLDPASAGVVQIALRRLRDERVRLLATVRLGPDLASPVELDRTFPASRLVQLSIGPLSLAAVHAVLEERLGLELTRPEIARVWEATGGNAFFALELGRELIRTNTRPTPGQALRIPESLQELLGERLGRLPTDTGDALLQIASLARPTIEVVMRAHGDRERVLEALEAATREGVVELDGSNIRFAHPLLASICYERAPVWKRRAVHRTLAGVVSDVEEQARHMALAAEAPDAVVASYLEAAAEQAAARGAPTTASELYDLAAQLTPDDPALVRRRRFAAAKCHRLAGDELRAAAVMEQLLTEVPHGVERADLLFELALNLAAAPQALIELLDEALEEASDDDVLLARILGYRGWIRLFQADIRAALPDARAALEKSERVGDPALIAVAIGQLATAEGRAGEVTPGLLERGVEIEERLGLVLGYGQSPSMSLCRRLVGLGELDRARAILEQTRTAAATRGDERLRRQVDGNLGRLEWFAGNWQLALDHVNLSDDFPEGQPFRHHRGYTGRLRALAEADLGLVEQARASAAVALEGAEEMSDREWRILILGVLGRLELMLGDIEAALGYLRELPAELVSTGYEDPTAPVWADAIEALIAGGELETAHTYLEVHETSARRVGTPWGLASSARSRGLLAAAEGDAAAAFAAFERSLAELDGLSFPLERARTLLCLGTVRRQAQQKKAAREALEQALAIFEELGARLWAEKARSELRRISGRRPAEEELTETERRVAELAARGRTNNQIAAELFMGVSTVEAHLSHAYRKLGVRRAELAGRLAIAVDDPAKAMDESAQI
jgi:DNA-binding CsgD family transcriptional regulator